ncbi:MAG: magnesium transporter [Candidatus Niyogibacteria bacterium]|nr:magnesium transporter [Candidatus Niyogibacteria bacterium]
MTEKKPILENDIKESVGMLVRHRVPWLALGLAGGMAASFVVSKYEAILGNDIRLAFFIPVIVYLSDAIGTQTETIYVRYLRKTGAHFWKYIWKETQLGLSLGAIFGLAAGLFAYGWLKSADIGLAVGIAMFVNMMIAPIVATVIPMALYKEHADPALGAGPLATVIQDLLSLIVYFLIATLIIF